MTELTEDRQDVEDGERLVLKALLCDGSIEETQADKESDGDTESCLGVDVRRRPPVLLVYTVRNEPQLSPETSGMFPVRLVILGRRRQGGRLVL